MARRSRRRSNVGAGVVLFAALIVMSLLGKLFQFVIDNKTVFIITGGLLSVAWVTVIIVRWVARERAIARDAAIRLQQEAELKSRIARDAAIRLQQETELESRIAQVRISGDRADYIIGNDDYRRGTRRENFYRKTFFLSLLAVFGNRCANCATPDNGVDIDHFVFSKNEGGSFAMFHREGFWINNAIPLCQTCNRSKLDRSYEQFFAKDRLLDVLQKNTEMTKRLNDTPSMVQFRPGRLPSA